MTIPPRNVVASAKGLIVHLGKFLTVLEAYEGERYWGLPGGKIEWGETPKERLTTEVKEEVGLAISVGPFVGVCCFPSLLSDLWIVGLVYRCTPKTTLLDLSKNPDTGEIADARWVTLRDFLVSYNSPPQLKNFLKRESAAW